MSTITNYGIKDAATFKHAKLSFIPGKGIAVITATSTYIPIEEFKEIFEKTGELVKKEKISKLIFDKTELKVFHQPSMEWYFTQWKEKMFDLGLKKHRKILPNDDVFKKSVQIGREKILKDFPNIKAHQMEILYSNTLEDAINN